MEGWAAFRDRAGDEVPMLVDGVWPVGALGFIAGPPKKGKTWLALLMALAVASGRPFLGRFAVPEPQGVIYVALEGTRAGLRARVGALARGAGIDPDGVNAIPVLDFSYKPRGLNLSDPVWANRLADTADMMDARLVVVDVLRRAASVREDGQGAADFMALARNLEPLEQAGCAVAIAHHFGKGSETNRARVPAERMAGSGSLYGAMDVGLFIVESSDDARLMRVTVEARDIAAPDPFTVRITGTGTGRNGGFTFRDTAAVVVDDSKIPTAAEALAGQLRELREAEPEISKTAAAARLGTTRFRADFIEAWEATS